MIHYSCRVHAHFPQLYPPKKVKISSLSCHSWLCQLRFLGYLSIREPNKIVEFGWWALLSTRKKTEKMKHETRGATHGCMHFEGHYHNHTPLDTQNFPNSVPTSARAGGTLLATVISTISPPGHMVFKSRWQWAIYRHPSSA
jgi:hypothetical protein